jgi:hypothetical protein
MTVAAVGHVARARLLLAPTVATNILTIVARRYSLLAPTVASGKQSIAIGLPIAMDYLISAVHRYWSAQ